MADVKIKLNKEQLDEAVGLLIDGLEKTVKSLQTANGRLKTKVTKLETRLSQKDALVDQAKKIVDAVKEAGGFYNEEEMEDARENGYC